MQIFYMIIGKGKLYLYKKENNRYIKQYIEGNSFYKYEINQVKLDLQKLLERLVDEYNLETKAELEFYIVENEDELFSEAVIKGLKEYVIKKYSLTEVLISVMEKLCKDKKLKIKEFGINYDGKSYLLSGQISNKKVKKSEFSLLAYTICEDDIMKFI